MKRGARNTLLSGIQAVFGMACMFWAYRILLHEAGAERMGLWTLLFSSISIARLADVTGSGGLARFVAEARGCNRDATTYIHTLTLATIALYFSLSLIIYFLSDELIKFMVEPQWRKEALAVMPLAIVAGLFSSPVAALLASGIDGLQRADLRALLVMASYVIFLILVNKMVPQYGIWGWGVALVVQQILTIVGSWVILSIYLPRLGFAPYRWSFRTFRETLAFGLKLQVSGVASHLSEPLAKIIMGKVAGLEAVALYELSAKLVTGLRGILVQMAMPLIPEFAVSKGSAQTIESLLRKSTRVMTRASIGLLIVLILAAPIFSSFMLSAVNTDLLVMIAILGVGWTANALAVPHYFAGIGCNFMRWNIGSHFAIAASVVIVGGLLGPIFGAIAVVIAITIGLIGGAFMVRLGNGRALNTRK